MNFVIFVILTQFLANVNFFDLKTTLNFDL